MKLLKIDLIVWRIMGICYWILIFFSALPILLLLQLLLEGNLMFDKSQILMTGSLIGFSVVLGGITLCFRGFLIKKSSRTTFKSPCEIDLGVHNEEDLISLLPKKLKIREISENSWYGKERGKRDLRVFAFAIHEEHPGDDLSFADSYVKRINDKTRFPDFISTVMHQNMGRVQLFLYDEVPQSVLYAAAKSVEDKIMEAEFLVDLFVDLKKGVLYLPFCRTYTIGVVRLYQYVIIRVAKWLYIANDNASTIDMIP